VSDSEDCTSSTMPPVRALRLQLPELYKQLHIVRVRSQTICIERFVDRSGGPSVGEDIFNSVPSKSIPNDLYVLAAVAHQLIKVKRNEWSGYAMLHVSSHALYYSVFCFPLYNYKEVARIVTS